MSSAFRGLEIAKSGLIAASLNQDITGQNISNGNTDGYTRQMTVSSARTPAGCNYVIDQVYNKMVGQGVDVTDVQQYRSEYLDQQYRGENSVYNYREYRQQGLTYLTGVMNELDDDSSITTCLNDLTSAFKNLAEDPTSQEYRLNVQQSAEKLIQDTHYVHSEMVDLWEDQNASIKTVADSINSKTEQITLLNEAIAKFENGGNTANDLRDERNNLLDELSGLVDITYSTNTDSSSMVDVQIGGVSLIKGTEHNEIECNLQKDNDGNVVNNAYSGKPENVLTMTNKLDSMVEADQKTYVLSSTGATSDMDTTDYIKVDSGELYAHMEMLTSDKTDNPGIPYYIGQFNSFVQNIVQTVNAVHKEGYTYPNGDNASATGVDFFKVPDGGISAITAGNFDISDKVKESVWNIAASSKAIDLNAATTNAGNADQASKLYNLFNGQNFNSALNTMVDHLAIVSKTNKGILDTSSTMLKSVSKQRKSLCGVSMDEETTNLIKYQQSYDVASRMITTIDEMLSTLINSTGKVGL